MNLFNIYYILGILALIYLLSLCTWEHMTNSDVQKKQEHHKTANTWDSVHKKPESTSTETKLKGPQTSVLSESDKKEDPKAVAQSKTVDYPDVYGPEINLVPGHKDSTQSHSDKPEPYDFIPAADFPKGPIAPSPFLTNFSKIM